jgi:hypothetical protein
MSSNIALPLFWHGFKNYSLIIYMGHKTRFINDGRVTREGPNKFVGFFGKLFTKKYGLNEYFWV